MDDDFCWLFVHWDYNQCVLFVSVLHSQVGRELFLPKRLWFSFRFDFHRCIGSSLTWKLCLRNSGGGTPFWWWSVFWKVGCRIWRVSVEHIYVCICIYNIYILYTYIWLWLDFSSLNLLQKGPSRSIFTSNHQISSSFASVDHRVR